MLDSNIDITYSQVVSDPVVSNPVKHQRAQRVAVGCEHAGVRRLGTTTKSVEIEPYKERRYGRYRLHKHTRGLLPDMRVAQCMQHCGSGGVEIVQGENGVASFRGARACGSVWSCPICSYKIANERRGELNKLLVWAREKEYVPVLLTLTMRHGFGDALAESLRVLKAAKKRLHQSHSWLKVKEYLVGHVTATEVTYGASGWHPHYHVLMVLRCESEDLAIEVLEGARGAWLAALQANGHDCNAHGFQVQGASEADRYISKWGPAEELTLSGAKQGRLKGLSPWELLAAYADGDAAAGALFASYAYTFQGKRQLVWSPGLKDLIGLVEVEDEEAANADEEPEGVTVAVVESTLWRKIAYRSLQVTLLEVVEGEGAAALQAYLARLRSQFGC